MSVYIGCRSGTDLSLLEHALNLGTPEIYGLPQAVRIYEYPNKINNNTVFAGVGFDGLGTVYEFDKILLLRWTQPVDGCTVVNTGAELAGELGVEIAQRNLQYLDRRLGHGRVRSPLDIMRSMAISAVIFLEKQNENKRAILDEKEHWVKRLKLAADEEKECEDDADCCVICQEHPKSVIITPCLHQCICATCGKQLLEKEDVENLCPVCREPIQKLLHPIK
jgi:hypothetical protein